MRQQATTLACLAVCSVLFACNGGEFTETDWGDSPTGPTDGAPSVDPLTGGETPPDGSVGNPGGNPGSNPPVPGDGGTVSPNPTGPGGGSTPPGDGGSAPPPTSTPDPVTPLPPPGVLADITPARLITRLQYNNAVKDLLGIDTAPLDTEVFLPGSLYDNDASGLSASASLVESYASIADTVSQQAFANGTLSWDCSGNETKCVTDFVNSFATRAFRRPPSNDEVSTLTGLFTTLRAEPISDEPEKALEGVVAAILQMPGFLYQIELGKPDGDRQKLTSYEVASKLSMYLLGSIPDATLLDAASKGALDEADGIRGQAERLLDTPRANEILRHFHAQWLNLGDLSNISRDEKLYPEFTLDLASSMQEETLSFLEDLVKSDGKTSDIFTSETSFVNRPLAELYGLSGSFNASFQKVSLDPEQRRGLLTQASFLTRNAKSDRSNPIARGVTVLRKLLCVDLKPPPVMVEALAAEIPAGATLRQQLEAHSENPCAGCHRMIDPIGLSFENYDAVGRFRTAYDDGQAVDSSGTLSLDGNTYELTDALDFEDAIAASPSANACVLQHYMQYAIGRGSLTADEKQWVTATSDQARQEGTSIRNLLLDIVASDLFRYRVTPAPEKCQ